MPYGLEAFVQVDAAGTVRDLFAVESSVLYSRLGLDYVRALIVKLPQMSDGTLSAVVTPIATSVALGENPVDVEAIRALRDVVRAQLPGQLVAPEKEVHPVGILATDFRAEKVAVERTGPPEVAHGEGQMEHGTRHAGWNAGDALWFPQLDPAPPRPA